VIEEVFSDRIAIGVYAVGLRNLLDKEPSQKETQDIQDTQAEDYINVDTSNRKSSSIPTLANESSNNGDDDLDTPLKIAISKLKRRALVSTPPPPKKIKVETAAF
jgi:hypothetical protein